MKTLGKWMVQVDDHGEKWMALILELVGQENQVALILELGEQGESSG
ncbi:hypothetical protein A2U01_0065234 [Trifolium medium]|uniref:Uncharacterized protein n=1 Tax=Trifolium medium TaxID=97028 RepID=A0A392S7X4_9FABA|nr:hypothetical protein [Trifolium medium]